jgi:hypothetical protein
MKKTTEKTPVAVAFPEGCELYSKAKALAQKLIDVEQDPDLLSVFGIARAHGYKATSRFWHDELKALVNTLMAYDQAKGAACPEPVAAPEQSDK